MNASACLSPWMPAYHAQSVFPACCWKTIPFALQCGELCDVHVPADEQIGAVPSVSPALPCKPVAGTQPPATVNVTIVSTNGKELAVKVTPGTTIRAAFFIDCTRPCDVPSWSLVNLALPSKDLLGCKLPVGVLPFDPRTAPSLMPEGSGCRTTAGSCLRICISFRVRILSLRDFPWAIEPQAIVSANLWPPSSRSGLFVAAECSLGNWGLTPCHLSSNSILLLVVQQPAQGKESAERRDRACSPFSKSGAFSEG